MEHDHIIVFSGFEVFNDNFLHDWNCCVDKILSWIQWFKHFFPQ